LIRYPAGIAENIPVKIRNFFIPVNFVNLDMEVDTKTPLILGRPFLSIENAHIDVGAREIQLNINGQKEKFAFKPKVEQCSHVKAIHQKKKAKKETKKPSISSIEALIEFVESLRIQEEMRILEEMKQIKLHNHRNARRRIQLRKFMESKKKEVETTPTTKKVWRKTVSSSGTPCGDDNRTRGMESPAPD
jgi:hypothetical protein